METPPADIGSKSKREERSSAASARLTSRMPNQELAARRRIRDLRKKSDCCWMWISGAFTPVRVQRGGRKPLKIHSVPRKSKCTADESVRGCQMTSRLSSLFLGRCLHAHILYIDRGNRVSSAGENSAALTAPIHIHIRRKTINMQ